MPDYLYVCYTSYCTVKYLPIISLKVILEVHVCNICHNTVAEIWEDINQSIKKYFNQF